MAVWHEQDSFWETIPLFSEEHWTVAPTEVRSLLSLFEIEPGGTVLDLCCGTGRHSLALARGGYRVTGVDRTAAYLQTARAKASSENLEVEFVQADMREFIRPAAYGGALNLYTSFGYFEDPMDDRRVVENVHRSLRPGGTLVMEMMGKEVLARIFSPRDWQETPDGTLFLQERKVSHDWTWMENRWIVVRDNQRTEYSVEHRIYDGAGLRHLLLDVGFESVALFGSLEGIPYDSTARRLVAVALKASA